MVDTPILRYARCREREGFHARPAAALVILSRSLSSDVYIEGAFIRSMSALMLLDVDYGDTVRVSGSNVDDVERVARAISQGLSPAIHTTSRI